MAKKSLIITILILCIGLIMMGCPKKPVVKEEPSAKKEEAAKIEAERVAKEKESKTKEEFEKSLVAKRKPGIEGEVFESSLLKDIHFDFDKYDGGPEDMAILRENAALLKKYPNVKVQIEGHCDERGTIEYNLALGERRATSTEVRQHFSERVFRTVIPRNIRLSEAPSHGKPIILYDIRCQGAEGYLQLAREVIDGAKARIG